MQINGVKEFFSKIAISSVPLGVRNDGAVPTLTQQRQQSHDSFSLSDIGKRLCLNVGKSSSLLKGQEITPSDSLSGEAKKVDKAMAKVIDIMERMRKLAVAAQDENLSDLDRVEMQIEVEDLRANLMAVPISLRTDRSIDRPFQVGAFLLEHNNDYGDSSSMLERMRTRIMNGEEWDVREVWSPYDATWKVVDDQKIFTQSEGKILNTNRQVPTVRDMLEATTPVVVMDSESSAKGVEFLDHQIASVKKWREQLPENLSNYTDVVEEACAFLENRVTLCEPWGTILTDPTIASNFLFGGKVYDHIGVTNRLENADGHDILTLDEEMLKNKLTATGWANP